MESGTTLYEFRHSTNGGSSYGSWTTLTQAALQALDCVGNGQDALQVRVTQTSSMDNMGSPATRQVDVGYEPARYVETGDQGGRFVIAEDVSVSTYEGVLTLV